MTKDIQNLLKYYDQISVIYTFATYNQSKSFQHHYFAKNEFSTKKLKACKLIYGIFHANWTFWRYLKKK